MHFLKVKTRPLAARGGLAVLRDDAGHLVDCQGPRGFGGYVFSGAVRLDDKALGTLGYQR